MGRKPDCSRKTTNVVCRNLSETQRHYIEQIAGIESAKRKRVVSLSKVISEIISEHMQSDTLRCKPSHQVG